MIKFIFWQNQALFYFLYMEKDMSMCKTEILIHTALFKFTQQHKHFTLDLIETILDLLGEMSWSRGQKTIWTQTSAYNQYLWFIRYTTGINLAASFLKQLFSSFNKVQVDWIQESHLKLEQNQQLIITNAVITTGLCLNPYIGWQCS